MKLWNRKQSSPGESMADAANADATTGGLEASATPLPPETAAESEDAQILKRILEEEGVSGSEPDAATTPSDAVGTSDLARREAPETQQPWRGIASYVTRRERKAILIVLFLTMVAMTFVQFGLIGIGVGGNYSAYLLGIAIPISLCALLFGKGYATLFGLVSGFTLWAHSTLQPLDLYESYFIGPIGASVVFALSGFVLGLGYSIALRNNPKGGRRVVYLCIATLLCSSIITLSFLVSTFFHILATISITLLGGEMNLKPLQAIFGLGDPTIQIAGDWLLLFITSAMAIQSMERYRQYRLSPTMRSTFRQWLLVVVYLAFMLISAVSFIATTESAKEDANAIMSADLNYLSEQLGNRLKDLQSFDESAVQGLPTEVRDTVKDAVSVEKLLEGYSLQYNGTVVIIKDGLISASNSKGYKIGAEAEDSFGPNALKDFDVASSGATMSKVILNAVSLKTLSLFPDEESGATEAAQKTAAASEPANNEMLTPQLALMRVTKVNDYYIVIMLPTSEVFASRGGTMAWMSLSAFFLLLAVYVLTARLITGVVEQPIASTNAALAEITKGNLDTKADARGTVEFAALTDGINATVDALKVLIDEADRKLERDLATARVIQKGALPDTFPPFPELDAFDLYAAMFPAKEVGGDFYDFFLIDDHTLGFLIADVSGKGIPGSLFMMAAKRELKNAMMGGMSLSDAVLLANAHLCAGNMAGMFVTVWAAMLDWQTGELTYLNAGHNPPLLRRGRSGAWEWLNKRGGLFLGTFEKAKYRTSTIMLEKDDQLLLYTDGVNEAFSATEEEYGNDRLEAFLQNHNDMHPRELIHELRSDLSRWAEGAEQSDDITMLCLEFGVAPEIFGSVTVNADLGNLQEVLSLVDTELDKRLCPLSARHKVEVALEELYVNVCRYAYANREKPGKVTVSYVYDTDPSSITVELRDDGIPFNPLTREDPTLPSNIQEAKVGGLGIFMVKKTMDDFSYAYDAGTNVVVFRKEW